MTVARIEGYASIFNVSDLNGDIVAPGAFAKALGKRGPGGVRMLYQHAVAAPLGRWTRLKEDARGLYAVGELILETARARDIAALIEGGALDGLSIGFQTVKARKEREGRVILEADLWEISIVTFPMAEGARIRALSYPAATDEGAFAATLKSAAKIFVGAETRFAKAPPSALRATSPARGGRKTFSSPVHGGGVGEADGGGSFYTHTNKNHQ